MNNSYKTTLPWCYRIHHPRMRVYSTAFRTMAAKRQRKWLNTSASRHRTNNDLISQSVNINAAIMQLTYSCRYVSIVDTQLCMLLHPTPLSGTCRFGKVEDSSGYWRSQKLDDDKRRGWYASNSLGHPFSIPSTANCLIPLDFFKMLRLRTRMISRRGSSRGHVSRQPSSSTSETSSEALNFRFDRYPDTRSRRGRGQGCFLLEEHSLHPNSQTVRFRVPCTLGSSSFTASVTVELCEASEDWEAESSGHPSVQRMED